MTFVRSISSLRRVVLCALCLATTVLSACDSGDLLDLAFDPPSRKTIDTSKVGVNSFFVTPGFGSIDEQFSDIRNNLNVRFVRILLAWTDGVQSSPGASRNYSFYDSIISRIPPGVDVIVVLAHTPSWMSSSSNWTSSGDPRATFVDEWVRPTVRRYSGVPGIIAWEVWNEPNLTTVSSDEALGLTDPANYALLLTRAFNVIRNEDPTALVVMAATTSIQQNFPNTLNYNKQLRDLGIENVTDVYNVHYYGTRYESVVTDNGVADFLNGIGKPVWVTESGEQGPNNQLAYVETTWPFLQDKIPSIQRFYYYQYSGPEAAESNYGLRTPDPSFPVSDLYVHLRERAGN